MSIETPITLAPLPGALISSAQLTVCRHASSVEDARSLLDQLGINPGAVARELTPEPQEGVSSGGGVARVA